MIGLILNYYGTVRAFRSKVPRSGQLGRCRPYTWPQVAIVQGLKRRAAAQLTIDYHLIDANPNDDALTFLLDHLPPPPVRMHLVIATRDDPHLPLARYVPGVS